MVEFQSSGQVVHIPLSDEERISGVPTMAHLQEALITLHRDGIVVLNNAVHLLSHPPPKAQIDTAHLDIINERMAPDACIIEKMDGARYNGPAEAGNLKQHPVVFPKYMFEDVYANRIVAKVLNCVLGPRPELRSMNGNTALHGKIPQGVHADLDFENHLDFPFAITVNFYLVDAGPENGATEWWVGTHTLGVRGVRIESARLKPFIREDAVEERRKICPPCQPTVPKGSVIIRDLRIWHTGVPNATNTPRIMFSWVYFAKWYENKMRIPYPESARSLIEKWSAEVDMLAAADFVPDDEFDLFNIPFIPDHGGAGRGLS